MRVRLNGREGLLSIAMNFGAKMGSGSSTMTPIFSIFFREVWGSYLAQRQRRCPTLNQLPKRPFLHGSVARAAKEAGRTVVVLIYLTQGRGRGWYFHVRVLICKWDSTGFSRIAREEMMLAISGLRCPSCRSAALSPNYTLCTALRSSIVYLDQHSF